MYVWCCQKQLPWMSCNSKNSYVKLVEQFTYYQTQPAPHTRKSSNLNRTISSTGTKFWFNVYKDDNK